MKEAAPRAPPAWETVAQQLAAIYGDPARLTPKVAIAGALRFWTAGSSMAIRVEWFVPFSALPSGDRDRD